mgnify:CR=1 FL=1
MRGATSLNRHLQGLRIFLLTRPMRGATSCCFACSFSSSFLLTRPMRGATRWQVCHPNIGKHFYSHAPCGARLSIGTKRQGRECNFYSHAPCGARRLFSNSTSSIIRFLLTRPMRGATIPCGKCFGCRLISTHTPHAGRDVLSGITGKNLWISTHTPHAGRDPQILLFFPPFANFYSHAPCGARQFSSSSPQTSRNISTHTPHAGRDGQDRRAGSGLWRFLLTRPMRGATRICDPDLCMSVNFYSHAPCGARPTVYHVGCGYAVYFYSHAPCGARHLLI